MQGKVGANLGKSMGLIVPCSLFVVLCLSLMEYSLCDSIGVNVCLRCLLFFVPCFLLLVLCLLFFVCYFLSFIYRLTFRLIVFFQFFGGTRMTLI